MTRERAWLPIALAIGGAAVVQAVVVGRSWFFLDDVRNLADASRHGLTWGFLVEPIGAEHISPGHRLLDWLVAEPFGRGWAAATALMIAWSVLGLAYLSLTMRRLFGSNGWYAVPVFLAGTAWPVLGTEEWFAGAGLAIPASAAISAALFHHVMWRSGGSARHGAAAVLWILVGLAFSIQTVFAPVLLLVVVLACVGRFSVRRLGREALALAPLVVPIVAYAIYVHAQSWAPTSHVPPLADAIALTRTIAVRGTLPALLGMGMDSALPDPSRETAMQALAAVVFAAGFAAAVILRNRWVAGAVMMATGVLLTSVIVALGRLDVLDVTSAGTEARYLLPVVLMGALGIAALMTPQAGRRSDARVSGRLRLVAVVATVALAAVYAVNLRYTSNARSFSVDEGRAARQLTATLSRSITTTRAQGRESSIADGELPPPLYYPGDHGNRLSRLSLFFTDRELTTPGIPDAGHVLQVGSDGALQAVPAPGRP